jgi:hypothetical protein
MRVRRIADARRRFSDMKASCRRYRIATHEAGHAVCGRLLGLPCGEASLDPPYACIPPDCGARSVCAIYAGGIAEHHAFGSYDPEDSGIDREMAAAQLTRLGVKDGGRALWRHTCRLLRPHGPLIGMLALRMSKRACSTGPPLTALWPAGPCNGSASASCCRNAPTAASRSAAVRS